MGKNNGIWITPNDFVTFEESRRKISDEIATRDRAMDFMGRSLFFLPDPDPVLRNLGKDIAVYQDLLSDDHLGSTIESRKSGVLSLEWELEKKNGAARQVKLLQELFENLDIDEITTSVLDASLFGYQPLEIMWEKVGPYILPGAVVAKPPEWFVFSPENELRFRTRQNLNGEPLPDRKFLLARNEPTYKNPYGKRVLSRCFWPVTFKRGGIKFWIKFIEKFGMPWVIGKVPRGTPQPEQDRLLDALESMVQDALAVIPDDSSVETLDSPFRASSGGLYEKFAEFMNNGISKTVLGQTLTTQMQSTGSLAATQGHLEVRKDVVDRDKKIVEKTYNTLIKYIYDINFSSESRPKFRMYEEEDVDKALAERDKLLTDSGVRFTRKYWQKTYGLVEEDIDETKEPPTKEGGEGEEFAEAEDSLESAADKLTEDAQALQAQAAAMLDVVMEIASSSNSYEEFNQKIAEAYPEMDTDSLMKQLEKTMFVSQVWGRLNASEG